MDSKRIVKEIEESDLTKDLKPLSEIQRNNQLKAVEGEILSLAKRFEGELPEFDWVKFKHTRSNAKFASSFNSHPNLLYALNNAGEIFEQADFRKILSVEKKQFKSEISKARDIKHFVDGIVNGLMILAAPETICFNHKDLAIAIAGIISACLKSEKTTGEDKKSIPLAIIKDGCIAWVHYEFSSTFNIKSHIFKTTRLIEINATIKYFCFKSEEDFRLNLFEAERKLKEEKAVKNIRL